MIEVREKSKQLGVVLEASQLAERDVPDYIEVDHNKMTATFVARPGPRRRAVPGADGTEPGRRVLLALTRAFIDLFGAAFGRPFHFCSGWRRPAPARTPDGVSP